MKKFSYKITILIIIFATFLLSCGGGGGGGGDDDIYCIVTFDGNGATGGSIPESKKVLLNQAITLPSSESFERIGYIFLGWSDKAENVRLGDYYLPGESYEVYREQTIYAIWAALPAMCSIPGQSFSMSNIEITNELYNAVTGEKNAQGVWNYDRVAPVIGIRWFDAIKFCNLLSIKMGLSPVYSIDGNTISQNLLADGFRLPTEAEWIYSARGGEAYTYAGSDNIDEVAWYFGNITPGVDDHPRHVGQKKANGYGLYDMTGNVYEWCWDGLSPDDNIPHTCCGGDWMSPAVECEISNCVSASLGGVGSDVGFRVVKKE